MKKIACALSPLMLSLTLVSVVFGQDLDMDCRSIDLVQCRPIVLQLEGLESSYENEIKFWEEELRNAVGIQRSQIIAQIRKLRQQKRNDPNIPRLQNQLAACRRQFDSSVPRRPVAQNVLNAQFVGNLTSNTIRRMSGPEVRFLTG